MDTNEINKKHIPENERFSDDTGMHLLSEENMWCKACKHCQGNVLSCGIYSQKPDGVLEGDECHYYDERSI